MMEVRFSRARTAALFVLGAAAVAVAVMLALALAPGRALADGGSGAKALESGTWGTCPWTLYDDGVIAVGSGVGANVETWSPWDKLGVKAQREDGVPGTFTKRIVVFEGDVKAPADCGNLFQDCYDVVGLEHLDTSATMDMSYMFFHLGRFGGGKSLDLSGFDTSRVIDMHGMFDSCSSLESLDLSGFDTARVKDMASMFELCSSLGELDLSSFDTKKVTSMAGMFCGCAALKRIGLASFDTSRVTDMEGMFERCAELARVDLSRFDTSRVSWMNSMFSGCKSLRKLDLSSFDTSKTRTKGSKLRMFSGCGSLRQMRLGKKFSFKTKVISTGKTLYETGLPKVKATKAYTGKWARAGKSEAYTSSALARAYAGGPMAGTYSWQKRR